MNDAANTTGARAHIPDDRLAGALADAERVRQQLRLVYQGPQSVLDTLLIALVARGHVLVEGVPGVAKTTLVSAFATVIDCDFKRIQFTPDLMPGDITGNVVLDVRSNAFQLHRGPIFANVVLGDEVNRAPAKTQSAMLEAMQERQVTIEGRTLPLPEPFVVLATQNPIEQEGVYPLPEAQLDRFLVKIAMGYPSAADEVRMLRAHGLGAPSVQRVLGPERAIELARLADGVYVDDKIMTYLVALSRWTRQHAAVLTGASPRATLGLMRAARARALLRGRDFVNVDDVRALVSAVFAHRLVLTSSALIEGITGDAIVAAAVKAVPYDPA